MFLALGRRMAEAIKKANPGQTASVEVLAYALTNIVHSLTIIIAAMLIGFADQQPVRTATSLIWFMGLRLLTGGYHFKSLTVCAVFSVAVAVLSPFASRIGILFPWIDYISLALIALFAPARNKSRIPDMVFKAAAFLAVSANAFLLQLPAASVTVFVVSLMLCRV